MPMMTMNRSAHRQPDTPLAVEAAHVSFAYGRHAALQNVSFAIPEGSYVGIVGPNGGGKTTMLKILLGFLRPSSGTVSVLGRSPEQARKSGAIGYVPQRIVQTDVPFPATVEEVVRSGRVPRAGIGRRLGAEDIAQARQAMEKTGVSHLRDRLIGTLSGGERQKVFIARALAAQPRILILDEPTTGVDAASQEEFYALLKKLHTEMTLTILFVSHDIDVIARKADFVLALNQQLICHCSAHQFLSEDTLKRLYGSDAELRHHHHH